MRTQAPFETMGIVNLTPDSFSDGGEVSSAKTLGEKIAFLRRHGVSTIDVGGHSTAPGRGSIPENQELERFDLFFECFDSLHFGGLALSLDTYRPRVFGLLYEKLLTLGFKGPVIWNDVSGVLDQETLALLGEYPEVSYIFTYTNIPSKEETPAHGDFIRKDGVDLSRVVGALKEASLKLSFKSSDQLIFDLGFGFSKDMEQNWALLAQVPSVLRAFEGRSRWCFGLSRKSMFSRIFPRDGDFFSVELIHLLSLEHILSRAERPIFRLHDPRLTQVLAIFRGRIASVKNLEKKS